MSSNIFLKQLEMPTREKTTERSENVFLKQLEGMPEKPEGKLKSSTRTAVQAPLGYAKRYTYPLDLFKASSHGMAKEALSDIFEEEPIEQRQAIGKEIEKNIDILPTQESIEELIEEKTGLPLRPKTELQKKARLGGTAAGFRPGGASEKATAAIAAPLVAKGLESVGASEGVSEFLGLLASGGISSPNISKIKKPSGLTSRMFEKVKKPLKVSAGRHEKITESLEKDFKGISEDILNKNPDYKSIKTNPNYRSELNEAFEKVEEAAQNIPEKVNKRHLKSFMARRFKKHFREMKGITPSESEETFRKEFHDLFKKVNNGPEEFNIPKLTSQFRKNNNELAEYFEPGKSKAFNTGKRDALLEYNRSIEELFETVHPNSEFTKLFKDQNKRWSQLMDVEAIEDKLSDIFKGGKISFSEVGKLLDKGKANLRRPFKRMMGKEGFQQFESLLKDFVSVENPYKLLKKAEIAGFKDLAKLAGSYIIHPSLAKLHAATNIAKNATRVLLDKPQLSVKWKSAFDNLKAGKYPEAQKEFEELDAEVKKLSEKVKPFETKARTLPEGYSPEIGKKITESSSARPYIHEPSLQSIKDFNLNEPSNILTKTDAKRTTQTIPLTKDEKVIYKNSWPTILPEESFNKYYNAKSGDKIGTVGDFIKNPKLKKMYEKVIDTPIYVENLPSAAASYRRDTKSIYMRPDYSPSQFYSNLMHETHHALQDTHGIFEKHPYTRSSVGTTEGYLKHVAERKARLAGRYVIKDLLKAQKASEKIEKLNKNLK